MPISRGTNPSGLGSIWRLNVLQLLSLHGKSDRSRPGVWGSGTQSGEEGGLISAHASSDTAC